MDNTIRMQQTDDAWNSRDWDAFDRLHDPELHRLLAGQASRSDARRS